jgi:hypothetical protein
MEIGGFSMVLAFLIVNFSLHFFGIFWSIRLHSAIKNQDLDDINHLVLCIKCKWYHFEIKISFLVFNF